MHAPRLRRSRREILTLLCVARRTAAELAEAMGISTTAVRKSLAGLEADGLVRYERVGRGAKKPLHEYRITELGELALSRAYLPLLKSLLQVQAERLDAGVVEEIVREAGRRLSPAGKRPEGTLAERAEAAALMLRGMGADATAQEEGGRLTLRCTCCAISAVVAEHPVACKAMEALLSDQLGTPVRERCDRSERPSCRFELMEFELDE